MVTEFFEGQASGDVERMKKIMHPDLRLVESAELPYGGDYRGQEGFLQIMANIGSKFELTVDSWCCIDADPHAFSTGQLTFRSIVTGETASTSYIDMWAFADDGRAVEIAPHLLELGCIQALHDRAQATQR